MGYCRLGAVLVFDITNASSFSRLENWLDDIKSASDPDIVIILVGNKVDLNRSRYCVLLCCSNRKVSQ